MEKENKSVSRRKFIGTAAAVGTIGALGISGIVTACGKKTKTGDYPDLPPMDDIAPAGKKLKAGLVGCGNRGTGAAIDFLNAGPGLEITALADVFMDQVIAARTKLKNAKKVNIADKNCFSGFDAYQKLIDSGVDIVLLATPPHFRPEHFEACVKARKHVFLEKPIAVDPVGIRKIIATGKKAEAIGLSVITGTQRRHKRDYIETYKHVADGAIGEIVAANAYWNQAHVWYRTRQPGWSDMEYMIRNWNNFTWLSGDHILDTHVHNIDIINWFTGKHPDFAIGYGGRHHRLTGDQYDFFAINFHYENSLKSNSYCRQIDNCANFVSELVIGTKGYTNCENKIFDHSGKVRWEYEYPKNKQGESTNQVKVSPYVQEHIHLVTSIRTNKPYNEAEQTALSTLTAIMGRESAYTGKKVSWDEIKNSDLRLGPEEYDIGTVNMEFPIPKPGTPIV